jgi:hypothetical protein
MSDTPDMEWMCECCGQIYAEYVNGCPICWERGDGPQGVNLVGVGDMSAPPIAKN